MEEDETTDQRIESTHTINMRDREGTEATRPEKSKIPCV